MPFFTLTELNTYAAEREKQSNYHQGSKGGLARILATSLQTHEAKLLPGVEYPIPKQRDVDVTVEFSIFKTLLYVAYLENLAIEQRNHNTYFFIKLAERISSIDYFPGLYQFDIEAKANAVDKTLAIDIPARLETAEMKKLSQGLHNFMYGMFKQIGQYENAQHLAVTNSLKVHTKAPDDVIKKLLWKVI